MNKGEPIYPRHRLQTLEPHYSRHMGAMTELPGIQEGLHSKSDIAEQLAWRDQVIARLKSDLEARDNAVRLALLDELEARGAGMIPYPLREQVAKLRLKYTPPRGKL